MLEVYLELVAKITVCAAQKLHELLEMCEFCQCYFKKWVKSVQGVLANSLMFLPRYPPGYKRHFWTGVCWALVSGWRFCLDIYLANIHQSSCVWEQ